MKTSPSAASRLRLLLASVCALVLAACGDDFGFGSDVDRIEADPLYFADQIFDCDPATDTPTCPPFNCSVDENGAIFDCTHDRCAVDNDSTYFEYLGGSGDLCVPPTCVVTAENTPPVCDPGCSDDDVTVYLFHYTCR